MYLGRAILNVSVALSVRGVVSRSLYVVWSSGLVFFRCSMGFAFLFVRETFV